MQPKNINREPSDYSVLNDNAVFVGSDEHTSGRAQGEYLADYFKSIGKTDVSYILLRGTEGLVHTNLRSEEAIKAMEEAGLNLTEAAVVEGEYDRNTAKSEMDVVLPNLDFDCVISNNDAMALGALLAMNDAGIEPGSVPVVGIDATEDGRNAIRSGEMAMTVFQSAKGQAEGSVVAAVNMLEGSAPHIRKIRERRLKNTYILLKNSLWQMILPQAVFSTYYLGFIRKSAADQG